MIASNGTNEQPPELKLDDLLALMKQLDDMTLARLPEEIVSKLGREVALRLARSAEGRSIGATRVLLPPGYEKTGECFLIQDDKLIHIGGSVTGATPIPVVMGGVRR